MSARASTPKYGPQHHGSPGKFVAGYLRGYGWEYTGHRNKGACKLARLVRRRHAREWRREV